MEFSSSSVTPILPTDLLSGPSGGAAMSGATQEQRIKAVSKAMEGIFAGQLMKELGEGLGGPKDAQTSGLYQDFIQQAMAQQVTSGGGFGLAKFLESSLTPAKAHASDPTLISHHVHGHS